MMTGLLSCEDALFLNVNIVILKEEKVISVRDS